MKSVPVNNNLYKLISDLSPGDSITATLHPHCSLQGSVEIIANRQKPLKCKLKPSGSRNSRRGLKTKGVEVIITRRK